MIVGSILLKTGKCGMLEKQLLIIAHAPSENTKSLLDSATRGARSVESDSVKISIRTPFEAEENDICGSQGIILLTTENLGYMSGALKDFFDRIYYPCLEKTQGLPYSLIIRAGYDGTGTVRAVETITNGLRWRKVQEPLTCRGKWQSDFNNQCKEYGAAMAAGLDLGIF